MRYLTLAAIAAALTCSVPAAAQQAKYTWDGHGSGNSMKCGSYAMHIELVNDQGRAKGHWQQKGRTVRSFDFPVGADGAFAGEVKLDGGVMKVKGSVKPDGGAINLTGYCNFGGQLKKG